VNIDNFKKVLDHIEAHPETWKQAVWHTQCGTAHCFAGWCQKFMGEEEDSFMARSHAMSFLQITSMEANWLFDATRTMEDFRQALAIAETGGDIRAVDPYNLAFTDPFPRGRAVVRR
jgi:hypothetical protein